MLSDQKSSCAINYRYSDVSIIIEEIRNYAHNFPNELLAANAVAERSKLSRRPKSVHRHATREIVVLSRDLAMNEGVHASRLPSSLPLYKLHDGVTWFDLNTWGRKRVAARTCVGISHACSCVHCHYLYLKRPPVSDYVTITLLLTHIIVRNLKKTSRASSFRCH